MRARVSALVVALLAGLAAPANADDAVRFAFDRSSAAPNERVTIRASRASGAPVRLYLVRRELAGNVHSRFDKRLSFVGSLVGRALRFSVPPLDPGGYALAYRIRGDPLVVQRPGRALLRIQSSPACPVTLPNRDRPPGALPDASWHGNGLLWTRLDRDGVYAVSADQVAADGSIGDKLLWVTTPRLQSPTLSGRRLDASVPRLRVSPPNRGSSDVMIPVSFPTAGCWRVTARVGDVSLTYVVSVIVR